MPFDRYRSIEDMPPPWREPGPDTPRRLGEMLALYRRLRGKDFVRKRGIQKFRSAEEMWAADEEFYRRPRPKGSEDPLFDDPPVWDGETPSDLAEEHDRYLYDDNS